MKTALCALLLLSSSIASAACFTHPDTGVTYCTAAAECRAGTTWNQSTLSCHAPTTPPPKCRIIIEYDLGNPFQPTLYPFNGAVCGSKEEAELALEAVLALLAAIPD